MLIFYILKITYTFVNDILTLLIYCVYVYSENLIIFSDILHVLIGVHETDNGIIISQIANYLCRYGRGLNGSRLYIVRL